MYLSIMMRIFQIIEIMGGMDKANAVSDNSFLLKKINKHDKVSTANDLVTASYYLELQFEKMMYFAISVVNKYEMDNNENFNFENPVLVYAENMVDLMWDYDDLSILDEKQRRERSNRIRMLSRTMKRFYDNTKIVPMMEVVRNENGLSEKIPMISKLGYDNKHKYLSIYFPAQFYEFFYKMAGENGAKPFNRHEIKYIMKMDNYFSLRLYRYLNAHIWRDQSLVLDYDDIRFMLDKRGQYQTHQSIKNKLIEPAIEEINTHTNISVEVEYIKVERQFRAAKLDYKFNPDYILSVMEKRLEELRLKYLKNAIPWSADGSHFKSPDREKYFEAPKKLSRSQILALINLPTFLNDYGHFIGVSPLEEAKAIMDSLLTNKLDTVNAYKKIDLDYYLEQVRFGSCPMPNKKENFYHQFYVTG